MIQIKNPNKEGYLMKALLEYGFLNFKNLKIEKLKKIMV